MNFSKSGTIKKQRSLKSTPSKLSTKFSITLFRALLVGMVSLAIICLCAGVGFLKGILDNTPDMGQINVAPVGFSTTIYDQDGNELIKLVGSSANRVYATIDEIPETLQNAFVAVEDERFWEHSGVDVRGIFRAAFVGVTSADFSEGASTLTQQLLKNNVFNGGREDNFLDRVERKLQEQFLAIQLEKTIGKKQIMEYYLNTINLGQNTLGVQAATNKYFNKHVNELTISEASVIAAITQNPTIFDPVTHSENNSERRAKILSNMKEQGYISEAEYSEAVNDTESVYARILSVNQENASTSSVYSYFIDELITQVIKDLQEIKGYSSTQATNALYRGGLSIYTTQDSKLQKICTDAFSNIENFPKNSQFELTYRLSVCDKDDEETHYNEKNLLEYFKTEDKNFDLLFPTAEEAQTYAQKFKEAMVSSTDTITGERLSTVIQPQSSFVIIDQSNGQVKAIIGGRGKKEGNRTLNRATSTVRQPGSTFKILSTFLPALDTAGMTLATVQDDLPYTYPNGKVLKNWNNKYKGLTSIREAITQSMNIVTVKTLNAVTPQIGYDYLLNLGFTTLVDNIVRNDKVYSDINLSLALGGITDGVTNLELTSAYAAIANNGTYIEPTFYTKILDHDNRVLIDKTPTSHSVMKESTAWLLTNAMQDVVKVGTGTAASFSNSKMPVAGKTGTTTDSYDLWFCGYTPYYTASIWSGYDNNNLTQEDTSYHKKLWRIIMEEVNKDLSIKEFEKPSSIVTAKICTKSGKLAVDGVCNLAPTGSTVKTEYFTKGTVPTDKCDAHVKLTICTVSNKLATEFCPSTDKKEMIYLLKQKQFDTNGVELKSQDYQYELPTGLDDSSCDVHTHQIIIMDPEETTENTIDTTNTQEPSTTENTTVSTNPTTNTSKDPVDVEMDNP